MKRHRIGVALIALAIVAPTTATGDTTYGDIEFPVDEHQHLDGLDYWWGAADVFTTAGNHYTVGIAFVSFNGYVLTGHQVIPHQGDYQGSMIMTADGPTEWGHPEEPGEFIRAASVYVPGVSELLTIDTLDTRNGLANIGRWERTTLEREEYRLRLDQPDAKVHPTGEQIGLSVDLTAEMQGPPLLAGGTGSWWYGLPQTYGYPSRSFQYMQAARSVTGELKIGTGPTEIVDAARSRLVMIHEYDAAPEDIPAGLTVAMTTQMHPAFFPSYQGGMPWELLFLDLGNGSQLMVAVLAFHDTPDGTVAPIVGPDQVTYRVLATLRLSSGQSIPLDDELHVEHLSYRTIIGRVPTLFVSTTGVWLQAWDYRVSHPGGTYTAPNGDAVTVPPFDLGVVPQLDKSEPAPDERGNHLTQRIPYTARGSYDGCAVDGFGWSEIIINWYRREHRDPWFTGGPLPEVPGEDCDAPAPPTGTPGDLDPPPMAEPPTLVAEGCQAYSPGPTPRCEYTATTPGGIVGSGAPGGWTVTITRGSETLLFKGLGGTETYACGAVQPGDHVVAEATEGGVTVGTPGFC